MKVRGSCNKPFKRYSRLKSTIGLALSSNLDENEDKVSEKSHKIISLVSYVLAAPFLPLQTRNQTHLNGTRVHRVAEAKALQP